MTTPEIDPQMFTKDRELDFAFAVTLAAEQYSVSVETMERYEREHSPETQAGRVKELEDNEDYQKIAELVGDNFAVSITEIVGMSEGYVTDEAYAQARISRQTGEDGLLGYVFGYHDHMADNLQAVFGDDEHEIAEASWSSTWQKLRDILHPVGKTYLAEVADFFDNLVRAKYGEAYDSTDRLRGPVVSQDISARTFYEVMEKHLSRAIMRSGEDGWTGY